MLKKLLGIQDYVDPEIIAELKLVSVSTRMFTPDIAKLEKYDQQKLFVCDAWMSDRPGYDTIRDHVIHNVVAFTKDKYDFLMYKDQALPVPNKDGHQIKGELLVVPRELIYLLDKLKGNTLHYIRRRVSLLDPHRLTFGVNNGLFTEDGLLLPEALAGRKTFLGEEQIKEQTAWMYLPHPHYWEYMMKRRPELFERVQIFQPKEDKRSWLGDYYKFQNS